MSGVVTGMVAPAIVRGLSLGCWRSGAEEGINLVGTAETPSQPLAGRGASAAMATLGNIRHRQAGQSRIRLRVQA